MRRYMKGLLDDVNAFERMLEEERFETGIRRIGAEQEMFIVDDCMRPAPLAMEILADTERHELVNELARFNLEANLQPRVFGGTCLSEMEAELNELVALADSAARRLDARVALCGILPSLRQSDLGMKNMTPKPRYAEINRATTAARGGNFHVIIKGRDELDVSHDNVMLEACNTSFQLHFQVAPNEFAKMYNMAQAITAPVLAAAVNSPVLLGRRLWHETRVALFQHSVDARSRAEAARNVRPRVSFGDEWVRSSPSEVYRENIARFRVLFVADPDDDPQKILDAGGVPKLSSLCLHNGTVYRWNRVCYGQDGKVPHLRIENRVLPAGPTTLDEMANAAFYYGLMAGCTEEYGDITEVMQFDDARNNFFEAAQAGLEANFSWVGGEEVSAPKLILDTLLPLARQGLQGSNIEGRDIDRYLGTLEARVRKGRTGARWCLMSLRAMGEQGTNDRRHRALTQALVDRQFGGTPVSDWSLIGAEEVERMSEARESYQTVGQIMSTDLFTVRPEDLVDMAASIMDWEHLRHVPVEDDDGKCVGILSHRKVLRLVARGQAGAEPKAVSEVMKADPITVTPETHTLDAVQLMRSSKLGCLPVVDEQAKLVGIITESDLIGVAARLLDEHLRGERE
ncbi:MAG: hypothetical protein DHS20C15_23870 [Planctomycetota bacterium]|nr:MAG: hypothetical protein DHS20C15_23870 [Planctomycetota bacterium]